MIDLDMMVMSESALVYHGANKYIISQQSGTYAVDVELMDEYLENIIGNLHFVCSTLSSAIATVESIETARRCRNATNTRRKTPRRD